MTTAWASGRLVVGYKQKKANVTCVSDLKFDSAGELKQSRYLYLGTNEHDELGLDVRPCCPVRSNLSDFESPVCLPAPSRMQIYNVRSGCSTSPLSGALSCLHINILAIAHAS